MPALLLLAILLLTTIFLFFREMNLESKNSITNRLQRNNEKFKKLVSELQSLVIDKNAGEWVSLDKKTTYSDYLKDLNCRFENKIDQCDLLAMMWISNKKLNDIRILLEWQDDEIIILQMEIFVINRKLLAA